MGKRKKKNHFQTLEVVDPRSGKKLGKVLKKGSMFFATRKNRVAIKHIATEMGYPSPRRGEIRFIKIIEPIPVKIGKVMIYLTHVFTPK